MNEGVSARGWVTDEELTTLALSADPHPVVDPRVAPWRPAVDAVSGLLPEWYMPAPAGTRRGTPTRVTIGVLIASFVVINALGLCITYGFVALA